MEAWRVYFDHLNTPNSDHGRWLDRGNELFTTLMGKMATALRYHFDPVVLKKGGYYPQGHGDIEGDQQAIRKAARELLEGRQQLKVAVVPQEQLLPNSHQSDVNFQVETIKTAPPRNS